MPNFPNDVAREAYSHEVTSAGFWPGTRAAPMPIFYAYAYPTPEGFAEAAVSPPECILARPSSASSCCRTTPSPPLTIPMRT